MNHNIIIAQVGKVRYTEAHYKNIDKKDAKITDSKYSFEAVTWEILENISEDDKNAPVHVILVGTKDSYLGTVFEDFASKTECSRSQDILFKNGTREVGYGNSRREETVDEKYVENIDTVAVKQSYEKDLSDIFTEYFKSRNSSHLESGGAVPNFMAHVAIIEYGKSNAELEKNYNILKETIDSVIVPESVDDDTWDIYFDISNGFRSFPVYIYTLINYLIRIENRTMHCHIYYGMFEAKENNISPLVDLQAIDDLLLLINAVSEFNNCGSVKQIISLLDSHREWDIQIGEDEKETLSYAFNMFDYGTNANNLKFIESGIKLLKNMENKINCPDNGLNEAERALLSNIADDFSRRFPQNERWYYSGLMINMARWFHDMGREGNAAIAAQETIWTYIMERYLDRTFYHFKIKDPKKVRLISKPNELLAKSGDHDPLIFKYDIREEISRLFIDNLQNTKPVESEIYQFFQFYGENRNEIRNPMAHFSYKTPSIVSGESDHVDAEDHLIKKYGDKVKGLIDLLDKEINLEKGDKDSNQGDQSLIEQIANAIFETQEEIEEWKEAQQLKKMLENIEIEVSQTDEFSSMLEKLRKEMRNEINLYTGNEDYNAFYFRIKSSRLLSKCFDKWIQECLEKTDDYRPTRENYIKYYEKNKSRKSGPERLKNYMYNHSDHFISILE